MDRHHPQTNAELLWQQSLIFNQFSSNTHHSSLWTHHGLYYIIGMAEIIEKVA